jgi:2,4-didehydro-3-deoxy-L-rhamnonate hydrolase
VRIANLAGRLVIVTGDGAVDVETTSSGRFSSDPQAIYARWAEFREWASGAPTTDAAPFAEEQLGPPAPRPAQLFAIGTNYASHVDEGGVPTPEWPMIFTKFPSSLTGPVGAIDLPTGSVDWEVELVFVMGRRARDVPAEQAWDFVAGVTVGQDISEREIQLRGQFPQMSISKSLPGFSPTGPFLVTPDAVDDPDDLEISCVLDGETVQQARTSELLYSVPQIIEEISALLPMLPGDVVFTGTPGGVGLGRRPMRFLEPGQQLISRIEGIGEMRHTFRGEITDDARLQDIDAVMDRLQALADRGQAASPR